MGNVHLTTALVQAAFAASRKVGSYLKERFGAVVRILADDGGAWSGRKASTRTPAVRIVSTAHPDRWRGGHIDPWSWHRLPIQL